jgi:hypothetical protein
MAAPRAINRISNNKVRINNTFLRQIIKFRVTALSEKTKPDENGRTFGESRPYQNSPKWNRFFILL